MEQQDPRDKYRYELWIAKAPYLVACGDDSEILVYRSYSVSKGDDAYLPVSEYIREHGLVMVSTETVREDRMLGRVERTHYATPERRNLLMVAA